MVLLFRKVFFGGFLSLAKYFFGLFRNTQLCLSLSVGMPSPSLCPG